MKILSLFDGMSCGRVAIGRAGIPVEKYFASEIDKNAIKVAMANYPDTIQLGGVEGVSAKDVGDIDLLMGGSPCQGFSFAGKGLNFEDPRSKLFFEFVRLNDELMPKYFLLENVRMKKDSQDIISSFLGVEPVLIDSSNFSPQNRPRLYWTNIPGITSMPRTSEGETIKDILCGDIFDKLYLNETEIKRGEFKNSPQTFASGNKCGRVQFPTPLDRKVKCLVKMVIKGSREVTHVSDGRGIRLLTRNELEVAQTLPVDYTRAVSYNHAAQMIGNGWTVDVIAHILKNIKQ